jgi:hypothetical protein
MTCGAGGSYDRRAGDRTHPAKSPGSPTNPQIWRGGSSDLSGTPGDRPYRDSLSADMRVLYRAGEPGARPYRFWLYSRLNENKHL